MSIATGQITIIDYNDALSLTSFIGASQPKTQMFNPDNGSYTPDWAVSGVTLTASLYKMGSGDNIITDTGVTEIKWYNVNGGTETEIVADATHVFSGVKSQCLTIKSNEMAGLPGKDYTCKITYTDPTINMPLVNKCGITFSRVVNGGGIADAIAWAPQGNIFKNGSTICLAAQCDLWRGSVIDATSVTYRWFVQDSLIFNPTTTSAAAALNATSITVTNPTGLTVGQSIIVGTANAVNITAINSSTITLSAGLSVAQSSGVTVKHKLYDADAGAGWRYLSADVAGNYTGTATNVLTIYDVFVNGMSVIKCVIKDTDSSSNTYNKCFQDTLTFIDQTDPITVVITSTGGDVFKNGVGSSVLTAVVYQAGVEIDAAGSKYAYTWSIYNSAGVLSTFSGGAATKTGKSITVGDADVSLKATFKVDLT